MDRGKSNVGTEVKQEKLGSFVESVLVRFLPFSVSNGSCGTGSVKENSVN